MSDEKPSDAMLNKIDSTLPSKLTQEDSVRIQDVFLRG